MWGRFSTSTCIQLTEKCLDIFWVWQWTSKCYTNVIINRLCVSRISIITNIELSHYGFLTDCPSLMLGINYVQQFSSNVWACGMWAPPPFNLLPTLWSSTFNFQKLILKVINRREINFVDSSLVSFQISYSRIAPWISIGCFFCLVHCVYIPSSMESMEQYQVNVSFHFGFWLA